MPFEVKFRSGELIAQRDVRREIDTDMLQKTAGGNADPTETSFGERAYGPDNFACGTKGSLSQGTPPANIAVYSISLATNSFAHTDNLGLALSSDGRHYNGPRFYGAR